MIPTLTALPGRVRDTRVSEGLRAVRLAAMLSEEERKARIAYVIRMAREHRGLTPPQLADKVGRGRGTVNDWEAERSTPSLVDLGPLCAALSVEPRIFAELPPIPADPIAEYLVPTAESAVEEGTRRGRKRRAAPAPSKPTRLPRLPVRDTEAGRG
jgi:transcriptional regulator with XRE-family HTH domain